MNYEVNCGSALRWVALVLIAGIARGEASDNAERWKTAVVRPEKRIAVEKLAWRFRRDAARYEAITKLRENGVPAAVIFALHYRETDNSFLCSLAQGDSLLHRSVHVPRGRIPGRNPPYTWEECAIDAIYAVDRLDRADWSSIGGTLDAIEGFNGLGYRRMGVVSPYLWSGTTLYTRGKYVADGRYSAMAVDGQLGCAAVLKGLRPIFSSAPAGPGF